MKKKKLPNLNLKSIEKRVDKEEYKDFLKLIGNLKFLPEIKEHLEGEGYEEKQIELFYSYMTLSAESNSPRVKRSYTKEQKAKLKKLAKKNKGKKFDKFGNQVSKISIVKG